MVKTDKTFFIKHYEEIHALLKKEGITDVKIFFEEWKTSLYITIDPQKEKMVSLPLISQSLTNLSNKYGTINTIKVLGTRLFGEEMAEKDFPEGIVSFFTLKPTISPTDREKPQSFFSELRKELAPSSSSSVSESKELAEPAKSETPHL